MKVLRRLLCVSVPLMVACEPDSITEARDQIGRGGERIVTLGVPIAVDTLRADSIFLDFLGASVDTLANGVMGVPVAGKSARVAVGDSVGPVSGPLDSDTNPLLRFNFEEPTEVSQADLNLGEFASAVQDATLNTVPAVLAFNNTADAPLRLNNLRFGVARIDPATGQPVRDGGGNIVLETDGSGNPIVVALVDPSDTVYTIPRQAIRTDTVAMAPVFDRLTDLVIGGTRAALVAAGRALVGDGSVGTVSATDELTVSIDAKIGIDLTLGVTGASFDSSLVMEGLDIDDPDADQLAERIDTAGVTMLVDNGTPFGVEVTIAAVRDSVTGDVFTKPGVLVLPTLSAGAAPVDANGLAQGSTTGSLGVNLTGQQTLTFFAPQFTAGLRVRLLVPTTGNRGALRPSDRIIIRSGATVKLRVGGGS